MQKLPFGESDFANIRREKRVYVPEFGIRKKVSCGKIS
jgi:hypothetical protein